MVCTSTGADVVAADRAPRPATAATELRAADRERPPSRRLRARPQAYGAAARARTSRTTGRSSTASRSTSGDGRGRRCRPTSGSPRSASDRSALVALLLPVRPLPADRQLAAGHASPRTCRASGTTSARRPGAANYTININTEMNYWPAEIDQPRRAARAAARHSIETWR